MRVLIVVTSHDRLGDSARRTGVWLESFAIGYYSCRDAGLDVCVCSPRGGPAPIDPLSDDRHTASSIVQRYANDHDARGDLAETLMLSQVCPVDFAAVYYADGRGALWDLPNDPDSRALIAQLHLWGRPCAFVGHGVAALIGARGPDGVPLVAGHRLTAPGREEDERLGLPADTLSLECALPLLGALHVAGRGDAPLLIRDGGWITGQNAASSTAVIQELLGALV
jgi:putative intracellular protease/amidase